MSESFVLQGRHLGVGEVRQIRELIDTHPDWSRYRLSRELCARWDWRNGVGEWKDMAARTLLLKLEQRGWIQLPERRGLSINRYRLSRSSLPRWDSRSIEGTLGSLGPLVVQEVSGQRDARNEVQAALSQFHYLGFRTRVGENLQYTVRNPQGRLLAALVFGAAAWKCAPRDRWIGWSRPQREKALPLIANNSRFLILPWVRVSHLGSWILSQVGARISRDWQAKYGHPIVALESFIERTRFRGTAYRAANWQKVGATTGRSRQDRARTLQVPVKDVYVYALRSDFRERLGL